MLILRKLDVKLQDEKNNIYSIYIPDILNANVLTEPEQQDLKNHVIAFEEYMRKNNN